MARYEQYQDEMAYRVFVTDAAYKSKDNKFIPADKRWLETVRPNWFETAQRSGDEIAMEIIEKAGLVVTT